MNEVLGVADRPIVVDEIGIRIGVWGDCRLRSAFQPVFSVTDGRLELKGLRGYVHATRGGRRVAAGDLFDRRETRHVDELNLLAARLHGENRANAGVEEPSRLDLWLGVDMTAGIEAALRQIDNATAALGRDAAHLVCEVMHSEAVSGSELAVLGRETKARGVRLALDGIGVECAAAHFDSPIHKMRGDLFRNLSRARQAAGLVHPLLETYREKGAEVLIEGIETRQQLVIALNSGATLVQGFLLGQPQLAGAIIDETARPAADLIYGEMPANRFAS